MGSSRRVSPILTTLGPKLPMLEMTPRIRLRMFAMR